MSKNVSEQLDNDATRWSLLATGFVLICRFTLKFESESNDVKSSVRR